VLAALTACTRQQAAAGVRWAWRSAPILTAALVLVKEPGQPGNQIGLW
jgi:hypothetical protein